MMEICRCGRLGEFGVRKLSIFVIFIVIKS